MRALVFALTIILFAAALATTGSAAAHADALTDDFNARIEAALAREDETQRFVAVQRLFFQDDPDDFSIGVLERASDIIAELAGHRVTFAPLPADIQLAFVIDGFEYRPNIEPLGHVVFTDPAAEPGNDTKVLYGKHPTRDRLFFPLTVRRLVNPDAPPDKQLQILAMGVAHPPSQFEGWCDIALSNDTTQRITLDDQGVGNQTRIMRGQSIEACQVRITDGRGTLSLRLFEDDREIFVQRIEAPDTTIVYRRP